MDKVQTWVFSESSLEQALQAYAASFADADEGAQRVNQIKHFLDAPEARKLRGPCVSPVRG